MYGLLIHFRMKTNIFLILFTLVFSFESFSAFPVNEIDSLHLLSNNVNIENINQNNNPKAMTMEVVTMFVLAGLFLGIAAIFYILIEFVLNERLSLENLYICFLFFLLSRGIILSLSMKNVFALAKVR